VFKKASLIPFNPEVVYEAIKRYRGFTSVVGEEHVAEKTLSRESTPGFATPPPPD
jgi:hypothetical protein